LGGPILELAQENSRDLFIFVKKYGKQKKVSESSDLLRKGHAFPGHYIMVLKKFLQKYGFMGIKRRRI
jgi:hypothetical protein